MSLYVLYKNTVVAFVLSQLDFVQGVLMSNLGPWILLIAASVIYINVIKIGQGSS